MYQDCIFILFGILICAVLITSWVFIFLGCDELGNSNRIHYTCPDYFEKVYTENNNVYCRDIFNTSYVFEPIGYYPDNQKGIIYLSSGIGIISLLIIVLCCVRC